AIRLRVLGKDDPATLTSLHHLSNILHNLGQPADAETLCRTVLERRRRRLPAGHPDIASSLALLGLILTDRGKPEAAEEAEPLLQEARAVFRRTLPEGHWRRANARSLLGA